MTNRRLFEGMIQRGNKNFGAGMQVKGLPPKQTMRLDNFEFGMNKADDPEGITRQSMAVALDLEVDDRGRIIRAPGTTLLGSYGAVFEPKQVLRGTSPSISVDYIVLFDRIGNLGIKRGTHITEWFNYSPFMNLLMNPKFHGISFVDVFIFSDGLDTWVIGPNAAMPWSATVQNRSAYFPQNKSMTIAEGRLYLVGMNNAIYWSGVGTFPVYEDFTSITSGGEQLIMDGTVSDSPVAIRAMGNGLVTVLCTDAIWVGTPTGDPTRPLDFTRKLKGAGCISEQTAISLDAGVFYLAADGIRYFNGNESVIISAAINDAILPFSRDLLSDAGISQYKLTYNPLNRSIYFHTNTACWVFSLEKRRWFKRSLLFYGGAAITDVTGDGSQKFVMLGLEGTSTNLEYEDYDSLKYFGVPFTPTYEGPTSIDPSSKNLKMVSAVKITYSGYGAMQLYLQNQERVYEAAGPEIPLTLSTELREEKITFIHTGELLGLKFEVLHGKLEIAAIELDWIPRGPNFSGQIRRSHFERLPDGDFIITDVPGPAYGWFLDTTVTPNEIVFDDTLVGPEFAVVGYDTDGSPFIEV